MPASAADKALISHLAFWADMGVETAFEDAPVDRLKPRELKPTTARPTLRAPTAATRAESAPRTVAPRADIPATVEKARALAAAAPDLAALEAAIAAFDGCLLKTMGASRAVFARGRPDAPLMIVGEGPGADEDRQGMPFVGRAGQLLDRMLAAAGLIDQVFITNTVFWRPPANRTPTPDEQAVCAPFVERAIALVQPKILLLAGGASAKTMLKTSEGILSIHGQWRDWSAADGSLVLPAMATLHPAFLLRQPLGKKKAWQDLMTLAARLESVTAGR